RRASAGTSRLRPCREPSPAPRRRSDRCAPRRPPAPRAALPSRRSDARMRAPSLATEIESMERLLARRLLAATAGACVALAAPATASAQDALVTTDWVATHAADPKVRIVEVSVDPGLYEKGHVAGAVGLKWHSELCDPVARDILSAAQFEKLCAKSGIANDTTVVLYGDNNNWFAAWAVWTFTIYGHANVKIMNGGRTKWELEKRPWETTVPT